MAAVYFFYHFFHKQNTLYIFFFLYNYVLSATTLSSVTWRGMYQGSKKQTTQLTKSPRLKSTTLHLSVKANILYNIAGTLVYYFLVNCFIPPEQK